MIVSKQNQNIAIVAAVAILLATACVVAYLGLGLVARGNAESYVLVAIVMIVAVASIFVSAMLLLLLFRAKRWISNKNEQIESLEKLISASDGALETLADYAESKEQRRLSEMSAFVPSGMHRCYLGDPIHLEYASESLVRMTGYAVQEFVDRIGPDRNYCQVIYEPDRINFVEFVYKLAAKPGVATCEYRLERKDGSLIYVLDTMESRRNANGIMRGYSSVADITEYKMRQEYDEQKLGEISKMLTLARLKNSASQMQPHFLYNALASIREVILDDPEYASNLILDFSTHLRACIRSMSSDALISFSEELANIKAYEHIEKMRFGERLNVLYNIEDDDFKIVPLSIQPLVENAIKHGIFDKEEGVVTVNVRRIDGGHVIEVIDDGVGFDVDEVRQQILLGERDSVGLINLEYRLNQILGAQITFESVLGSGTKVTVVVPEADEQPGGQGDFELQGELELTGVDQSNGFAPTYFWSYERM